MVVSFLCIRFVLLAQTSIYPMIDRQMGGDDMSSEIIDLYLKYEKTISEAPENLQEELRTESIPAIVAKTKQTREKVLQTIMEWKANQS